MLGRGLEKRKKERKGQVALDSDPLLLLIRVGYVVGEGKKNLCVVLARENSEFLQEITSALCWRGRPLSFAERSLREVEKHCIP